MAKLFVFPGWFKSNPYLNLLYLEAQAEGYELDGSIELNLFLKKIAKANSGDTIHLHWSAPIVQAAENAAQANANINSLISSLQKAKTRGVKIIWTIHNVIPHETKFLDEEIRLAKELCEVVDVIHVLSPNTAKEVANFYELPLAKVVTVRHSSYWGIYDQSLSRNEARESFQIGADQKVVVMLGKMRTYKGLDVALKAVAKLHAENHNLVLMLAGQTEASELKKISELAGAGVRIIHSDDFISEDDLPRWLTAADVAVLPFRQVLNSGSIFLAATFGLPSVVAALGNLPEVLAGQKWAQLYVPDESGKALENELRVALKNSESSRALATEFAKSYKPFDMALDFYEQILKPSASKSS